MDPKTAQELLEINRRFYDEFGNAFALTRRRIQPGISRILETIPAEAASDWLDLGCGSGALGRLWAEQGRSGSYTGLDFSGPLLREAKTATKDLSGDKLQIRYDAADLMDPEWPAVCDGRKYDGVFAFASLHHIPGAVNHRRIFRQVRDLLREGGSFIFSVWQFQNSEKLRKRIQPWGLAGISEEKLEEGDTLLDWRFSLSENTEKQGLRYVHLFSEAELDDLADAGGFEVAERFYSDGTEGNLALYYRLKAVGEDAYENA